MRFDQNEFPDRPRRRHHRGGFGPPRGGFGPDRAFGGGPGGFGGPGPFGGPGGPFEPRGFGGRGGGRHRGGRARRGDVRIALLLLLAEEPRNGYGLMQEIESRSGGMWRPSPGSVYPALSQLEDEGLVSAETIADQTGKSYAITEAGRAKVAERGPDEKAPWEEPTWVDNPRMALGEAAKQVGLAVFQVARAGNSAQVERAQALLDHTRRELYRMLAEDGEPADTTADADA